MAPRDPLQDGTLDVNPTDPTADGPPDRGSASALARLPTGGDRYRIGQSLGTGGMGEVVLAHDEQIGRDVAIKRMHSPERDSWTRFLREARIQGRLEHPSIVPVHEVSVDAVGRPYFVMKRLAGTTLADILAKHRDGAPDPKFTTQRLLRAFAEVCLAVEFAHEKGVVHRDLKPANIMLGDFGEVYVLDWGIARQLDHSALDSLDGTVAPSAPGATAAGAVLGTVGYMPPEQLRSLPVDRRADVFALGCILFEILTNEPMLSPSTFDAVLQPYENRPSLRTRAFEIPPELDDAVVKATASEAVHRLATARALGQIVERYLDGDRDLARRRTLAQEQLVLAREALGGTAGSMATPLPRRPPTESERKSAMQHAGRALALDPTNSDAAKIVGRVMLEPPHEMPAEIDAQLAEIDEHNLREQSKVAGLAFLLYLAFLPLMSWVGATDRIYLGMVCLFSLANGGLALAVVRSRKRVPPLVLYAVVAANACLLFIMSRMFTSFAVAPGIACGTMLAFSMHPRFGKTWVLAVALSVGIVGPTIGELLHLWPTTNVIVDGALHLRSAAGDFVYPNVQIAHSVYIVALIYVVGVMARTMARTQREARRNALIQAWHLQQLMPPAARAATSH